MKNYFITGLKLSFLLSTIFGVGLFIIYQSPSVLASTTPTVSLSPAGTTTLPLTTMQTLTATLSNNITTDSILFEDTSTSVTSLVIYPSSDCNADIQMNIGEEIEFTDIGTITTCSVQVTSPSTAESQNFQAFMWNPTTDTVDATSNQSTITWQSWTLTFTSNGQNSPAVLNDGQTAMLQATSNFNLDSTPNIQLQITTLQGNIPVVQTCTTGTNCSGNYQEPLPQIAPCNTNTVINVCFTATTTDTATGQILATATLETEWQAELVPSYNASVMTSPILQGLTGLPQDFWLQSSSNNSSENLPHPETQTQTINGQSYTLVPNNVCWSFGDETPFDCQNISVPSSCSSVTANQSPNPCTSGGGYGGQPSTDLSVIHTYQQASSGTPYGILATVIFSWQISSTDFGIAIVQPPSIFLTVNQVQSVYAINNCQILDSPTTGNTSVGTNITLTPSSTCNNLDYTDYQFFYAPANNPSNLTAICTTCNNSNHSVTWDTTGLTSGDYIVTLDLDNTGTCSAGNLCQTVTQNYNLSDCSLNALTTNSASPQSAGTNITFSETPACTVSSTLNYTWEVSYPNTNDVPPDIMPTGTTNTWTWNTSNLPAGTYTITLVVAFSDNTPPVATQLTYTLS